jgi:hypothetical protein
MMVRAVFFGATRQLNRLRHQTDIQMTSGYAFSASELAVGIAFCLTSFARITASSSNQG